MKEYYPKYWEQIQIIFANLKKGSFIEEDLFWLQNELATDLQECETWDKQRILNIS